MNAFIPAMLLSCAVMCRWLAPAAGRWQPQDGPKEQLAALLLQLLQQNAPMLAEYLSLDITQQGFLAALPAPVEGLLPDLSRLPDLLLQLARDVDWSSEKECFRGLTQVGAWGCWRVCPVACATLAAHSCVCEGC
jgi:hypothetical protein